MRYIQIVLILAVMLMATGVQADSTQVGFRGWGPRVGLTVDPDQIHFGAHLDFGNFGRRVRFQPNFELGFGDNITLAALNLEAAYRFQSTWAIWTPYLGGGLGLNYYSWDNDRDHGDDSDTKVGLNVLGGVERGLASGDRFFAEIKIGIGDSPDFKFTIGWTFFHGWL